MMNTMSKVLAVQINDNMHVTSMTCRSPGNVTYSQRCQALAPSTSAASYCSEGIACIPARYAMAKNGNPFQITTLITAGIAQVVVPSQEIGALMRPRFSNAQLNSPF